MNFNRLPFAILCNNLTKMRKTSQWTIKIYFVDFRCMRLSLVRSYFEMK